MKFTLLLFIVILLAACSPTATPPPGTEFPDGETPSLPAATDTAIPPSPTPEPLAASVNGEAIPLAAFQAELGRFEAAAGRGASEEEIQEVMDSLINQVLLAQAAEEQGFSADDQLIQERVDRLVERLGSEQALEDWMAKNGYDENSLRKDLALSISAAWMRDQIIAEVPITAEQIHARQILTTSAEEANDYYNRLQAGADFGRLAFEADPIAGGELGWFARGYLFYPALEEAAFQLEPGAYTGVIQTPVGYHILQVIERDPARPLSRDALLEAQRQALQAWIQESRQVSTIEIH